MAGLATWPRPPHCWPPAPYGTAWLRPTQQARPPPKRVSSKLANCVQPLAQEFGSRRGPPASGSIADHAWRSGRCPAAGGGNWSLIGVLSRGFTAGRANALAAASGRSAAAARSRQRRRSVATPGDQRIGNARSPGFERFDRRFVTFGFVARALVLLAEIHLASNQPAQAAPLADRLAAAIRLRGRRLSSADAAGLALAIKVYVAGRQLAKAGEAAGTLVESGPDDRAVNSALVEYVRLLRQSPEPKPPAFETPANDAAVKTPSLDVLLAKLGGARKSRFPIASCWAIFAAIFAPRRSGHILPVGLEAGRARHDSAHRAASSAISQLRLLVVDLLRRERR